MGDKSGATLNAATEPIRPVAVILRELLSCSPKTGGKTTYKTLAEYLEVKQQSVSSWANGTTIPDTKHIAPLADYFGVTCDFLLGRTAVKTQDITIREMHRKTGLSEKAIEALTDTKETRKSERVDFWSWLIKDEKFFQEVSQHVSAMAAIKLEIAHTTLLTSSPEETINKYLIMVHANECAKIFRERMEWLAEEMKKNMTALSKEQRVIFAAIVGSGIFKGTENTLIGGDVKKKEVWQDDKT